MSGSVVLIIGDISNGTLGTNSKELLSVGKKLATDLGEDLSVALFNDERTGASDEAIQFGANSVYNVVHPLLKDYQVDIYVSAVTQLCSKVSPTIILFARTFLGRDLAPRVAFRLGVGLAQDCIDVSVDPGSRRLIAKRPVYGGNAIAVISCLGSPQIAAVRPRSYETASEDTSRQGKVHDIEVDIDTSLAKTITTDIIKEESDGVRLEDARIVIAGGRGLGGPEPFEVLEGLAKILGGTVGASRAAVDSGWVPTALQIGLTGKTITPDLYLTVGISGASQHMAGCSGSKVIVAINKDPEANIFKEARFGVVGDWKTIVTGFKNAISELLND